MGSGLRLIPLSFLYMPKCDCCGANTSICKNIELHANVFRCPNLPNPNIHKYTMLCLCPLCYNWIINNPDKLCGLIRLYDCETE